LRPVYQLLLRAAESPQRAWAEHEARLTAIEADRAAVSSELETAVGEADEDPEAAIARVDAVLPRSEALPLLKGGLYFTRALALASCRDRPLSQRQAEAIDALERARECATPGNRSAQVCSRLGILYAERCEGDRRRNVRHAIELYRDGLAELDGERPGPLLAELKTQLAAALGRLDGSGREGRLAEALRHCEDALAVIPAEHDREAWARAQVNRAAILFDLDELAGKEQGAAQSVYKEVIAHADELDDKLLLSGVHHRIAQLQRFRANRSPEKMVELHAASTHAEEELAAREGALLRGAVEDLDRAEELLVDAQEGSDARPRILAERCVVMDMLGEREQALAAGRAALAMLDPLETPVAFLEAAIKVGAILIEDSEWAEAAACYRRAFPALDRLHYTALDREARQRLTARFGHLGRWASLALAENGDLEEAVLALEGSRTRELRYRLRPGTADADVGEELPEDLREEYEAAIAEFAKTAPLTSGEEEERRLQAALEVIRSDPRFADFAGAPRLSDLQGACAPQRPLIYVNPTPAGVCVLALCDVGGVPVSTFSVPRLNSTEIFMRLLTGSGGGGLGSDASYLNAAGSFGEVTTGLDRAVRQAERWIGSELAAPIAEFLGAEEAVGVTLVLNGPLATYPLGAARWEIDGGGQRCLLDDFEIAYAPSATAAALCHERRDRAAEEQPQLVALGNPSGDLPAALEEVNEIARGFPGPAEVAIEAEADGDFLRSFAAGASHLHLACHGSAAALAPEDAGIELADGLFSLADLAAIGGLRARLTVLSACQSAIQDIGQLPGEATSAATALILAGSAAVIASLWPVDDAATALLMVRFYEEHAWAGRAPTAALRRAQLWLRDLDAERERTYLSSHPDLGAAFERRRAEGAPPGRRGPGGARAGLRPYAHPEFWAPFIAVGA
jgi:CHAT domain-containing protein